MKAKILLLIGSCAVSLFVAEAVLRLLHLPRLNRRIAMPDPATGTRMRRSLTFRWTATDTPPGGVVVRTNAQGFKDSEWSPDEPSIAFLGDSFTEALQVENGREFHSLVERRTGRQCMNLGLSGAGAVQSLCVLRWADSRYDIRAVVLQLYTGNDFEDDHRDTSPDSSRMYVPLEDGEFGRPEPRASRRPVLTWLTDVSHLARFAPLLKNRLPRRGRQSTDAPDTNARRTLLALEEIHRIAGERPMIVLLVDAMNESQRRRNETIRLWCEKAGLPCLDMTDRIGPEGHGGRDSRGHWNERGHEAVGEAILSEIAERSE